MKHVSRFAKERTELANERTMLAYMRTSLALFITGVTIIKFFDETMVYDFIGWGGILLSGIVFVVGVARFFYNRKQIIDIERTQKM